MNFDINKNEDYQNVFQYIRLKTGGLTASCFDLIYKEWHLKEWQKLSINHLERTQDRFARKLARFFLNSTDESTVAYLVTVWRRNDGFCPYKDEITGMRGRTRYRAVTGFENAVAFTLNVLSGIEEDKALLSGNRPISGLISTCSVPVKNSPFHGMMSDGKITIRSCFDSKQKNQIGRTIQYSSYHDVAGWKID